MIGSVSTAAHLVGALRRAAGKVFLTFFLTLIVVAAIVEGIGYALSGGFSPITHVFAVIVAVGWAIAVSLLVLVGEIVRGVIAGVRDATKDVEKQVGDAGKLVSGVISSVEHRGDKK